MTPSAVEDVIVISTLPSKAEAMVVVATVRIQTEARRRNDVCEFMACTIFE